ncbi:MAG: GDSL-type esterase/lipase family protein [Bacteroidia bacterium]
MMACMLVVVSAQAQQDYPYALNVYPFLHLDKNQLTFPGDPNAFEPLFAKMDKVLYEGKGQVQVVHIGGSHLQADMWSDRMRQRLQHFFPGVEATRGLLFPFNMAHTNNPYNYHTEYTGNWESCRNVQWNKACTLGLTGISATTHDSLCRIKVFFRGADYPQYEFNRVRVFMDLDSSSYSVSVVNPGVTSQASTDSALGYTAFQLGAFQTSLELEIRKTAPGQNHFTFYGISLESEDPGFVYSAIGVNGAATKSYLRCNLFEQHLRAVKPDLVIFSVGINDANTSEFDSHMFERNYDSLLTRVRRAVPGSTILFTTNNDTYYLKKYPNRNAEKVRVSMLKIAKKHNAAVWDLFEIMGGLGSIKEWIAAGLANQDKIHLLKPGYELVADMLFNALMQAYDQHLATTFQTTQK